MCLWKVKWGFNGPVSEIFFSGACQGGGELSTGCKQGILAWERTRSNNSVNLLVLFDISFSAQHINYTNFMLVLQYHLSPQHPTFHHPKSPSCCTPPSYFPSISSLYRFLFSAQTSEWGELNCNCFLMDWRVCALDCKLSKGKSSFFFFFFKLFLMLVLNLLQDCAPSRGLPQSVATGWMNKPTRASIEAIDSHENT